jgi:hypothetical protein
MLKLKNKLFDLIARNISIEDFEQWLYNDDEILNKVVSDDFVLELINRDYGNKHVFTDLEKLCFQKYSKDEFLVYVIESVCKILSDEKDYNIIFSLLNELVRHYDFSDDYELLFNFYCLHCETDCGPFGSLERMKFIKKVNDYSLKVLLKLIDKSYQEKLCFTVNGINID